ncbi:amino acid adenylation domain-containing protein [Streptomyces sp. NPDC098077]|uniref:amino acid adenylation domain-containing protein n=1 Tax=Streptomyces sp. NPDC098077 TaxID=3366093 RepID=UPI00382D5863
MELITTHDSVGQWFAEQARSTPEATAVLDRGRRVTYAELDAEAEALALRLSGRGVEPGDLVGVRVHRSWLLYAAVLAIWKLGCSYVPMDFRYPAARNAFIEADSGVRVTVTDVERGELVVEEASGSPRAAPVTPPDTAYVLYTSGSTGNPKGVVVRHRSVVEMLRGFIGRFGFDARSVWAQFTSPCFDVSVAETWAPLLTGGTVVVVPEECTEDLEEFVELVLRSRITVLSQVPTVFHYTLASMVACGVSLPDMRHVLLAGEPVDFATVQQWFRSEVAPEARLFNLYGPTEATVYATCKELTESVLDRRTQGTPIGSVLPHLHAELRNGDALVPPGASGEICLSGPGLAHGYLGLPEHTARSFACRSSDSERLYRTGDYAVQDPEGELHFVGRKDHQVKLRGQRIEIGEIEAVWGTCSGIGQCAVVMVETGRGEAQLVGFHVPADVGTEISPRSLRSELRAKLPDYMVPTRFVALDRLPLTPNGKLDRTSLRSMARADG